MDSAASVPRPAGGQPGPPGVPAEVLRAWDQAEARLFPLVMARPDLYERSVRLIGALAARLRETCPDVPALLAQHERGAALAEEAGPDVAALGVRPELIAAAACAMRYRELVTAEAAQRRLAALAYARDQGLPWTVVEESGDEVRAPYVPYQRVEAHVPSGRALIVSVEPDETLSGAVYRLEAGQLDLATGALEAGDQLGSFRDPVALADALARARAEILGSR
jgi:hypothetical protein